MIKPECEDKLGSLNLESMSAAMMYVVTLHYRCSMAFESCTRWGRAISLESDIGTS